MLCSNNQVNVWQHTDITEPCVEDLAIPYLKSCVEELFGQSWLERWEEQRILLTNLMVELEFGVPQTLLDLTEIGLAYYKRMLMEWLQKRQNWWAHTNRM